MINDCDIGCPLPEPLGETTEGLDWLKIWTIYSRMMSRAYDKLFSISATLNSKTAYDTGIEKIREQLEQWKDTIPEKFRPCNPIRPHQLGSPLLLAIAVRIHLMYYNLQIALSRLSLHTCGDILSERVSQSKMTLMSTARSIVDTTQFIAIEPFTSAW